MGFTFQARSSRRHNSDCRSGAHRGLRHTGVGTACTVTMVLVGVVVPAAAVAVDATGMRGSWERDEHHHYRAGRSDQRVRSLKFRVMNPRGRRARLAGKGHYRCHH